MLTNRIVVFLYTLGLISYITTPAIASQKKITLPNNFVVEDSPIILEHENFQPFTGIVKGNRVRIRNAPKLDSSILKEVSSGDLLPIVGESNNFYSLKPTPDMKGYVFRTFVVNNSIEGDQVNVRAAPSTTSPILCKLHKGDQITIYEEQDNWIEIELPDNCLFYISKEFIEKKGEISLIDEINDQVKVADNLLKKAVFFAERELKKPISQVNLEEIYYNINKVREGSFKDLPGINAKVENELEKIQQLFLSKKSDEKQASIPISNTYEKSKLSKHLRRIDPVKKAPALKNYEEIENSLYQLWLADLPDNSKAISIEDFYKSEHKKHKVLKGQLETYPYVIKNAPGQFILKNNDRSIAFLYSIKIDLNEFLNKEVQIIGLPRSNNYFAFPAFCVTSIEAVVK